MPQFPPSMLLEATAGKKRAAASRLEERAARLRHEAEALDKAAAQRRASLTEPQTATV